MDEELFTSTFTRIRASLMNVARRVVGNEDDAADALQDAFFKLWKRRESIPNDSLSAEKLSMTSVKNACIDTLRRNQSHQEDTLDNNLNISQEESSEGDKEALFNNVKSIIDKELSDVQRKILYLRDYEDYNYQDIAQMMNMSETNVRMTISRARRTVRECYLKYHSNE
jgi:RNA polymerase sigma-70 factor (ECF subfamily)